MNRRSVVSTVAWVAVALFVSSSWAEENLLVNPGFEKGDGKKQVEGWSGSRDASHSLDPAKARSGNGAVRVRFDDRFGQKAPSGPDRFYVLSGYVRREDPTGTEVPKIKVYFNDQDGKGVGGVAEEFPGTTAEYKPFRFSFVPPNGAATIGVSLCGEFHGSEWFWYDDLALTAVPRREMPLAEHTPSLNGKTVRAADIADCRSFALLRVPPRSLLPIDGLLGTQCSTRRAGYIKRPPEVCHFDLSLEGAQPLNYLLVHCPSPLHPVRSGQVMTRNGRGLATISNNEATTLSISLPRMEADWLRLAVTTKPGEETHIGEIQLFDIQDGLPPLPQAGYRLTPAEAPADYARDIALAFPRPEDRGVLLAEAAPIGGKPATRPLKAGCYQSILLPPVEGAQWVRTLQIRLDIENQEESNLLEIALKRCRLLDQNLDYLVVSDRQLEEKIIRSKPRYNLADRFRIYTKLNQGKEHLALHFAVPTMLLENGERLWLSIRPLKDATLHLTESRVNVETVKADVAEREVLPRLVRMVRWLYSIETEAHAYDGLPYQNMFMYSLVDRVLKTDPDNAPANHILRRIAKRKINVDLKRPGPADAPDWAVWSREALRNYVDILYWWIDHEQVENGELGGHFNDDTEFSCKWPPFCLITGDEKLATGLQKIADGCWEYMGESGYSISCMDVEHAAEDAQCSQPQMITVRYGNPEYLERLMLWSSLLPKWTAINQNGDRLFKSYMFNTRHVSVKPKEDIDHVYCAQAMAGPYTLAWYADTEIPRAWFLEWCRSWVKASMSTAKEKPAGAIPCDLLFATGEIAPYTKGWNTSIYYAFGQYTMENAFIAGYMLSLDPFYLQPFQYDQNVRRGAAGAVWRKVTRDTRHDAYFVGQADMQLAQYSQPVLEPERGPEKKAIAQAANAKDLLAPMGLVKDAAAPGGSYLSAPKGSPPETGAAIFVLQVREPGRYAACVQMRSEDATTDSFLVRINDGPEAIVTTDKVHNDWVWTTTASPVELTAGEHTVTVRCREQGAMVAQAGLTSKYTLDGSWRSPSELTPYLAWLITGDKKYLVEQLKETNRELARTRWLLTEAEPATDRVPVPGSELLPFTYLGGCAAGMKATFPYLALSWEGGGTDFSALVLENDVKHLKALVYSFAPKTIDLTARVWELEHGEYDIAFGPDKDRDDRPDSKTIETRKVLTRYDPIALSVSPSMSYVLEIRQVRKLDSILTRPDLAISARDIAIDQARGSVEVIVHNVGASDANDIVIIVNDENGQEIGRAQIDRLSAPKGANAERAKVRIPLKQLSRKVTVILDPEDKVPEIAEVNNRVTVAQ